ncbi:hypothetical protein [Shuttleworthella sp. MSX8B]|uniref:hypothetical protein n=1 Tax=Shuttleworthella sp. MSX8B TaxID=936574 RepID=UPI001FA6AA8C|nr:hypothetical protein [Shuttleworthia sp. MSX8B]
MESAGRVSGGSAILGLTPDIDRPSKNPNTFFTTPIVKYLLLRAASPSCSLFRLEANTSRAEILFFAFDFINVSYRIDSIWFVNKSGGKTDALPAGGEKERSGGSSDQKCHRICLAKKDPNIDCFCHTDIGSLLSVYMFKHYADQ